jgi:hypothetical protein
MMIQYLYRLDYSTQEGAAYSVDGQSLRVNSESIATEAASPCSDSDESTDPTISIPPGFELTFHSKVYTLAEKCWIDDLKESARQKFEAAASKDWGLDDFVSAAREAYTSTVDTDRGLRDAIINTLCRRRGIMEKKVVQDLVKELHALAYDMVVYMHRQTRY